MSLLNLCFSLVADDSNDDDKLEQDYQSIYKRFASFLYAHPKLQFSVSFLGNQLAFYKKHHLEFIDLIGQLTSRKQLEVLGGGYYNPIFPLLFPQDRSGQIELLTSELRQSIGKRPRGMMIYGSVWESSLIPCLQTCGMEYVFLDSSLVPSGKQNYLPIIMAYQGKTVSILPIFRDFEVTENQTALNYVKILKRKVIDDIRNDEYSAFDVPRVLSIAVKKDTMKMMFETGFLDGLAKIAESDEIKDIVISNPLSVVRSCEHFSRLYIPSGMQEDIAYWAVPHVESRFPITIYDLLQNNPHSDSLYHRMMYVSLLISQCHGDKMRKKEARERLWAGQIGQAYICSPLGVFANTVVRQSAFRNLNAAEKLARDAVDFRESITSFDYNADGIYEYVCQMQSYMACIERKGASITELEILHNAGNYADSLCDAKKGIFVDYLIEVSDFDSYILGEKVGNEVFSKTLFSESMFDSQRREVILLGRGRFSEMQQTLSLRKKYITTSSGIAVQYILKNESPLVVKAKLVTELNFADTHFEKDICYTMEIISAGTKKTPEKNALINDVSYVQLTDMFSNVAFVLEPNESAGVVICPVSSKDGRTISVALCWDVDLAAGREIEKTVNFSIMAHRPKH